jgi:hypothetical protein
VFLLAWLLWVRHIILLPAATLSQHSLRRLCWPAVAFNHSRSTVSRAVTLLNRALRHALNVQCLTTTLYAPFGTWPLQSLGAPIGAALLTALPVRGVEFVMACVLLLVIGVHCHVLQRIRQWLQNRQQPTEHTKR